MRTFASGKVGFKDVRVRTTVPSWCQGGCQRGGKHSSLGVCRRFGRKGEKQIGKKEELQTEGLNNVKVATRHDPMDRLIKGLKHKCDCLLNGVTLVLRTKL